MDYIPLGLLLVLSLSSIIELADSIPSALLLTPLIKQNKTEEARNASLVNPKLFLNVTSHSGFLTVDERYNSNTFFWYFPVAKKPLNETPWIIWLQGGPGSSSLAGLFDEIGPFEYEKHEEEGRLNLRQTAWTKEYSMVFIDNPIGTGYSFTDSELGYARNMTMYSNHLYSALQQFLTVFPELRKAPLYIAGESYAGRYVPGLATKIMEQGQLSAEWEISLQGLIMGNPVLNREAVANLTAAFYQWGLVDRQGVLDTKALQDQYADAVNNGNAELAYQYRNQLLVKLHDITLQQQNYNVLADRYHLEGFEDLLAREEIREALHVGQIKFSFYNSNVQEKLLPDFLSEVDSKVESLLEHYKVMIYCGQLDLISPCVPNAEARRKWHWSRRSEFLREPRVPWWHNGTRAGYVKSGGGFTEVLVTGAGHLVPIDKPVQAFDLVSNFIQNIDANLPPNYKKTSYIPESEEHEEYTTSKVISVPVETTSPPTVTVSPNITSSTIKTVLSTAQPNQTQNTPSNQNKTKKTIEALPVKSSEGESASAGTIVSIVINVILVLVIAGGAVLYYRQKKRTADFFYSNVDNNSDDIFLT